MIAVGQCFWRDRVAVILYVMALKEHSDLRVETPMLPCRDMGGCFMYFGQMCLYRAERRLRSMQIS